MKTLMMICFCLFSIPLLAGPESEGVTVSDEAHFFGTVTAVNSNGNRPGLSFTAVDEQGQVKMFYISTLQNLDLNDRVELTYKSSSRFPLEVIRIRFLSPKS